MTRSKVSTTVSLERLARARQVTGTDNLSQLLDEALDALIERQLERRWLEAHRDGELPEAVDVNLYSVPWDIE